MNARDGSVKTATPADPSYYKTFLNSEFLVSEQTCVFWYVIVLQFPCYGKIFNYSGKAILGSHYMDNICHA